MGVKGLWRLLLPIGRRISIETLSGQILAIDASIWLTQFIKAMRDTDTGRVQFAAHLIGFFKRICRLRYHNIKPIFVFDGTAMPEIKRKELINRARRRNNNNNTNANSDDPFGSMLLSDEAVQRLAKRILSEQLYKGTTTTATSPTKNRKKLKASQDEDNNNNHNDTTSNKETTASLTDGNKKDTATKVSSSFVSGFNPGAGQVSTKHKTSSYPAAVTDGDNTVDTSSNTSNSTNVALVSVSTSPTKSVATSTTTTTISSSSPADTNSNDGNPKRKVIIVHDTNEIIEIDNDNNHNIDTYTNKLQQEQEQEEERKQKEQQEQLDAITATLIANDCYEEDEQENEHTRYIAANRQQVSTTETNINDHADDVAIAEILQEDLDEYDTFNNNSPNTKKRNKNYNDWDDAGNNNNNSNNNNGNDSDNDSNTTTRTNDFSLSYIAQLPATQRKDAIEQEQRRLRVMNRKDYMPAAADPVTFSQTQVVNFLKVTRFNKSIVSMASEIAQRENSINTTTTTTTTTNNNNNNNKKKYSGNGLQVLKNGGLLASDRTMRMELIREDDEYQPSDDDDKSIDNAKYGGNIIKKRKRVGTTNDNNYIKNSNGGTSSNHSNLSLLSRKNTVRHKARVVCTRYSIEQQKQQQGFDVAIGSGAAATNDLGRYYESSDDDDIQWDEDADNANRDTKIGKGGHKDLKQFDHDTSDDDDDAHQEEGGKCDERNGFGMKKMSPTKSHVRRFIPEDDVDDVDIQSNHDQIKLINSTETNTVNTIRIGDFDGNIHLDDDDDDDDCGGGFVKADDNANAASVPNEQIRTSRMADENDDIRLVIEGNSSKSVAGLDEDYSESDNGYKNDTSIMATDPGKSLYITSTSTNNSSRYIDLQEDDNECSTTSSDRIQSDRKFAQELEDQALAEAMQDAEYRTSSTVATAVSDSIRQSSDPVEWESTSTQENEMISVCDDDDDNNNNINNKSTCNKENHMETGLVANSSEDEEDDIDWEDGEDVVCGTDETTLFPTENHIMDSPHHVERDNVRIEKNEHDETNMEVSEDKKRSGGNYFEAEQSNDDEVNLVGDNYYAGDSTNDSFDDFRNVTRRETSKIELSEALQQAQTTAANLTNWAGRAFRRAVKEATGETIAPTIPTVAQSEIQISSTATIKSVPSHVQNDDDNKNLTPTKFQSRSTRTDLTIPDTDSNILSQKVAKSSPHQPTVRFTTDDTMTKAMLMDNEAQWTAERNRKERDMDGVTDEMRDEAIQLLQLLGVPYVEAPAEAEAQCAILEQLGLVNGIVTEDSDVFVFGGKTVYKNIFEEQKYAEVYTADDAFREMNISRNGFVALAMLLGGDYTEGVKGVGIVNAMEVLESFDVSTDLMDGLKGFRTWLDGFDPYYGKTAGGVATANGIDNNDLYEVTAEQRFHSKHRSARNRWIPPPNFPSELVVKAYTDPVVDKSKEKFTWGVPDVPNLLLFCNKNMGWRPEDTNRLLEPVMAQLQSGLRQTRIDSFMKYEDSIKFADIRSKRIREVLSKHQKKTKVTTKTKKTKSKRPSPATTEDG